MQSGEVLSDEFQGAIAQTLGNLVGRIEESRQQQPPEQPPGIPPQPLEAPVSNDAQLLWVLSGQQPQAFISYLRTFPTPATQALLNNPQQLNSTIEHLSRTMPQGEPPVVDGIQHADLNSSNVWGANYDQRSGRMRVRFQGGSEYEYDGIPPAIFNAFIHGNASATTNGQNQYGRWWRGKNPSLGSALNQYIKRGNFPYRRIR
jgi:hypothetical protein